MLGLKRKKLTMGQMYDYVAKKMHTPKGYRCTGTLLHVGTFCDRHHLDKERVSEFLIEHGAGCDCELFWNTVDEVKDSYSLERFKRK